MPTSPRSVDDPPKRTLSFVCEVPLRVYPREERILLARLEADRQVYNACLGEARQRVQLVRESKAFQRARTLSKDDPERAQLFRAARAQHAFSDYALQAYAQQFGHAWLGEHLDSHVLAEARDACLWGRQPAAAGQGQASTLQGQAPAG
jgi:hypothetical protein